LSEKFSFHKTERISSQKELDYLFEKGNYFTVNPFRIVYAEKQTPNGASVSTLISVPKKKFKHAVDRNRLKRLFRESYRLNKNALIEACVENKKELLAGFIYKGEGIVEMRQIEFAVQEAINVLIQKI